MAVTDIYHISGSLDGRKSNAYLQSDHDDYIQVNAAAAALVTANNASGTWTAWINLADITHTGTIIGAGDDNIVEFIELSVEAGLLTCRATDATTPQFVVQADAVHFTPHRWYHVAVTQRADGNGVDLFVSGVKIAATDDTSTDLDSWFLETDGIDTMRIGAANKVGNATVTNDFRGAISDVKIWEAPLTDAQVFDDFNGIANTTNLHNHWDWDDDLVDAGSGLDNGTAVGDVLLVNNYSEFTSRLRNMTSAPVVADLLNFAIQGNTGHALVIQAA